jgi:hypothetical protein
VFLVEPTLRFHRAGVLHCFDFDQREKSSLSMNSKVLRLSRFLLAEMTYVKV